MAELALTELEFIILCALRKEDQHPYQFYDEYKNKGLRCLRPQVYKAFQSLTDQGFLEKPDVPRGKYPVVHKISKEGIQALLGETTRKQVLYGWKEIGWV